MAQQASDRSIAARRRRAIYVLLGIVALAGVLAIVAVRRQAELREVRSPDRLPKSLAGYDAKDAGGATLPLTPDGGGVVMVISRSCPHCHETLARLASAGGDLPRLRVLTIEGAEPGARLLDSLKVRGASSVGPADAATIERMGIYATPTFLLVDGAGRVEQVKVGAPKVDELTFWRDRSRGAAAAPAGGPAT